MQSVLNRAAGIRLVIFDVDGVLTDGGLHFDEAGRENKVFHSRDGHGLKMLQNSAVAPEHTAYVGDDVVDLPVMLLVGLAIAVADAHPLVKQHVHWQTPQSGGRGAVRDVCELILQAQGKLDALWEGYLTLDPAVRRV